MPSVNVSFLSRRVRSAAALCSVGRAASTAWAGPKAVVVEPIHLEIGEVEPGQPQKFEWTLRNDGDAVLSIESLEPTCYCTTGKADTWSIAAGQSTKVHVNVDPSDWVGEIVKGVEIETNDPDNKKLLLEVKMKVRPGIAVVPPELDFGAVAAGGSMPLHVDIKAAKERAFKIVSLAADAPFVSVDQEPVQTDDRVGVKLNVKIAPGVTPGPFATKIVVQTDDTSRPRIEVPVRGSGPGGLKVTPDRLTFDSASAGAEVGVITVSGGKGLKVTGAKSTTPGLEAAVQVQPDGSYQVHVKLGAGVKAGRLLGKLGISTRDA